MMFYYRSDNNPFSLSPTRVLKAKMCKKKRLKGTSKRELMSYGASVLGSLGPSVLTGLMSWGS